VAAHWRTVSSYSTSDTNTGTYSEIVDTCLFCLAAVLMFRTAIPNDACEGVHPGGGFADGATAEVTPPGKAKGEA
jgi:hypothetical protein